MRNPAALASLHHSAVEGIPQNNLITFVQRSPERDNLISEFGTTHSDRPKGDHVNRPTETTREEMRLVIFGIHG